MTKPETPERPAWCIMDDTRLMM